MLVALVSDRSVWHDMKLAKYFAARCKPTNLDVIHFGWTTLTKASNDGHLDILKALIAAGANKDNADSNGYTPLTMAAGNGHVECVKALLAVKADVNKATRSGWTPLMSASLFGRVEIVKLLLAAGAKKDKINTFSKTALTLATREGHHEIVQLNLKASQVDASLHHPSQSHVLHIAVLVDGACVHMAIEARRLHALVGFDQVRPGLAVGHGAVQTPCLSHRQRYGIVPFLVVCGSAPHSSSRHLSASQSRSKALAGSAASL